MNNALRALAQRVVDANNNDEIEALLEDAYHNECISIEAAAFGEGMPREIKGLDAIRQKHAMWESMMEMHSSSADGPYLHGDDQFAIIYEADMTNKMTGEREQMKEVALYTVENGKIVKEQFYYT